jgi:hypothetical protein
MKIQASILCEHLAFGGLHLFRLIVKFVAFGKSIALGYASKAPNSLEILGELRYGIGCQLMQLCLKLEQDIC